MKTNIILVVILSVITLPVFAQKTLKASFHVSGNCFMCKQRIEGSLDQPGIKSAVWNVETKTLEVVYHSGKINEQKIHELVAAAGHDTNKTKSQDEVYAKLPFCCLYRDHDHSGIIDGPHEDDKETHGHHE